MDYLTSDASTIDTMSELLINSIKKPINNMVGGKGFFNPFGLMDQPNSVRIPVTLIVICVFCFFVIDYEEVEEEDEEVKELKELY